VGAFMLIVTQYVTKYGKISYQSPGYTKTTAIVQPAFDAVRVSEKTAAEAFPPVVAEANKILEEEAKVGG